jgi:FkbM family methyltransferase
MNAATIRRYLSVMRHFRNSWQMIRALRGGPPVDRVVLWDGTVIRSPPGRPGLVETALEVWIDRVYLPDGFYQPATGDIIVDGGANVGLFTIWCLTHIDDCRVIALEPFPENFAFLEANVARLNTDRATVQPKALGAANMIGRMAAVGERILDHQLVAAGSGTTSVDVVPLANVFDLAGRRDIAFLKLDIEGSEFDVFVGASTDELRRICHLAMEYHDHIRPGTLALLKERLAPTHSLITRESSVPGCGLLWARRKDKGLLRGSGSTTSGSADGR